MSVPSPDVLIALGKNVLQAERDALGQLADNLDESFAKCVAAILASKGKVVITGVGKPYFIAQKISASMASTGTSSITLHPVDALHGDLGRIAHGDVVIMLSNSGASPEMVDFVRALGTFKVTKVAMTCNPESPMAKASDLVLNLGKLTEACPMGVAPSTTSTAMLAMGDALTLTLLEQNAFEIENFATLHPGGSLGKRLRPVREAMRDLSRTAVVAEDATIADAIQEITQKRCGAAYVVGKASGALVGILTDGDLRRLLKGPGFESTGRVLEVASQSPRRIEAQCHVVEAVAVLRDHEIDELAVVDGDGRLVGHVDVIDLL